MLPIPKKVLVLMVGIPLSQPPIYDTEFVLGGNRKRAMFSLRGFQTFEDLVEALPHRADAELIHISNEVRTPRMTLAKLCEELAPLLAAHPNKPWVNFAGADLNFLTTIFRRHGVRTYHVTTETAAVVRWAQLSEMREHALAR